MKEKLRNTASILAIPLRYARVSVIILILLDVINAITPSIIVLATSKFIDNILLFLKSQSSLSSIIPYLIIILICTAINWTSSETNAFASKNIQYQLRKNFKPVLVAKTCRLKYSYIENIDAWDLITRVSTDTEKKCVEGFYFINVFTQNHN